MKISREQGVHSKKRVRPTTRALKKEGTSDGDDDQWYFCTIKWKFAGEYFFKGNAT